MFPVFGTISESTLVPVVETCTREIALETPDRVVVLPTLSTIRLPLV